MTWATFWFDSNECWGEITNPSDWERIVQRFTRYLHDDRAYALKTLATAHEFDKSHLELKSRGMPNFGFRREHLGERTLLEWAKENNMVQALFEELPEEPRA